MATAWMEREKVDEDEVVRWRFDELLRAGYTWGAALQLARRRDVDLHLAERLLRTGCPTDTAVRILL